ncbi:thiamine pyrophosphate-dependent dehydrogenase E1 component subunit alpha [Nesterenkonia sphaerica]|uniref:2-oxoisovalerate dehydrogenase subunit alpha n=1 Tax=Nesterenkonia sphaerica TaxID=1804988 RepID=A0A5R9AKJ1_9MICC|nr:thiamine pyrophosphate-dependent dehydrogenase E1 component subunit alpha [Nesterenkonia sphaerica]TLP78970.1 thiamine pyrophosphate-dependent dehydrogenase E1 component subunit alpha [Nesterenkonia sphaerica]
MGDVDHMRGADLADPVPVQLLAEDGTFTEHPTFSRYIEGLDDETLRELYRHMVLERRFDTEATSLQRQGMLALWVPALGQEAAQTGVIAALQPTDRVFPTYREHAMALYRGVKPEELMGMFRAATHTGWDPHKYNFNGYSVVLASQVMHAVGWAMGIKQDLATGALDEGRAEDELVVACLGDGATSQGDAHESMVFASSYELPVLYFIQNNQWAISVPQHTQSRVPLAHRAAGYGFEGLRVDGNDVLATYAVTQYMAEQIRAGAGPKLVEAVTYRIGAHTTADDPTKYRTQEELEAWKRRDPILRYRTWLEAQSILTAEATEQVDQEAAALAKDLRAAVHSLEPIPLERIFDTVYAEPHRQVEVEKAWLKDYEAGFAEEGQVSDK